MHILLWLLYSCLPLRGNAVNLVAVPAMSKTTNLPVLFVGLGLPDEPLFFCGDGSSGGRTLQRMHLTLSLTSFSLFHSVSRCAILNA